MQEEEKVIIPVYDEQPEEENEDKTNLSGYATPDQVEAWKKQYGEVFEAVVDNKIAYFKRASRATVRAALSFISKDKLKYIEVVLVNCIIGGDKSVLDNDEEFFGLVELVEEITKGKLVKIKKR